MAEIGTKIKYLRETVHNLDQIELARLAKISNATVSDVEAGKVMPTQKTLEKISNVF
ncbi:MAG: helix-turn-helix transcriptional regulator [Bacillota bacterium]|nr:helix-turn-helix transcriptional regulator [Bacillota bacterium]